MASLYDEGWRQGGLLKAQLPLDAVVLGPDGIPARDQQEHDRWVVATQDCDLDHSGSDDATATIELRPVFTDDPPLDSGIRSFKFRLTETEYVHATSPRTMVSPSVLSTIRAGSGHDGEPPPERQRAFKTWLGRRYDRPAVPKLLEQLAKAIAVEVDRKKNRPTGTKVRDVLMQFDAAADPVRFSLFAVLESEKDRETVRAWLADIAKAVPAALGIADEVEARSAEGISLHLVETSYAADVAQLTWRRDQPNPDGAEPVR